MSDAWVQVADSDHVFVHGNTVNFWPESAAMSGRRCLYCGTPVDAAAGFYELRRQPPGDLWTLCSLPCLAAFVKGGDDE